jgi:phosphatidylglycerophosphate synthase
MITVSNSLSFIRAPLALLFWQDNPTLRFAAIFLAMVTDCIDGYFARRNKSTSQFGAVLDPTMDKFFVYFVLSVLFIEGRIGLIPLLTMLSRDLFLCLYGFLMIVTGRWKTVVFRAIKWGKITTALQFIVLMGLTIGIDFPWYIYGAFIAMGWLAFLELVPFRQTYLNLHR